MSEPVTIESVIRTVEALRYKHPPTAFVCTPETFRKLKDLDAQLQRERDLRFGPEWKPTPYPENPWMSGIPIRVEANPDPQPGEALLTLEAPC